MNETCKKKGGGNVISIGLVSLIFVMAAVGPSAYKKIVKKYFKKKSVSKDKKSKRNKRSKRNKLQKGGSGNLIGIALIGLILLLSIGGPMAYKHVKKDVGKLAQEGKIEFDDKIGFINEKIDTVLPGPMVDKKTNKRVDILSNEINSKYEKVLDCKKIPEGEKINIETLIKSCKAGSEKIDCMDGLLKKVNVLCADYCYRPENYEQTQVVQYSPDEIKNLETSAGVKGLTEFVKAQGKTVQELQKTRMQPNRGLQFEGDLNDSSEFRKLENRIKATQGKKRKKSGKKSRGKKKKSRDKKKKSRDKKKKSKDKKKLSRRK